MIIIKIFGGLGNQLFQYAFGKYLEKKLQTSVFFDYRTLIVSKNVLNRDLDILKLDFQVPTLSESNLKKFNANYSGLLYKIIRKWRQIFSSYQKKNIVQLNAHQSVEIKDNTYYDGYWQNYLYPDEVRTVFLEHMKLSEKMYEKNRNLINQMKKLNSVAIHIRRGDYIEIKVNSKIFEICDMNYYNQAISIIESNYPNAVFFIFTQDIEWAKEHFDEKKFQFVEGNSAIEDIILMSFCQHNIIANSTFSWWSAWLNKNPQKIVISPKKWYKGENNSLISNLIPPQWIRV